MRFMEAIKKWLGELTEIALLLIALGIVIQILFGGAPGVAIPFFGGIVNNLTELIKGLGQNGVVGLIALGIILFLFRRRATA